MSETTISAADKHPRRRVAVCGTEMTYIDCGAPAAEPIVFIHGNPTSSYLWRNVIPHLSGGARCLAPDLIGMGDSGVLPGGSYRFVDHARCLDAWFEALGLKRSVTLVLHDWGSALGFHWARRNPESVKGIAYMEAIVRPLRWAEWNDRARDLFRAMRSPAGEEIIIKNNVFIERILPASIMRKLTDDEMNVYRRPYLAGGERRRPMLTWPREIPFDGEPADVAQIVDAYAGWLAQSGIPKLFINADPGAILIGPQREFCRRWPNQSEVTVPGIHFLQEDCPHEIGAAIAEWHQSLQG